MEHYDYHHLRDEFLGKLDVPMPVLYWLDVRELPPKPFMEVLITGPTHKHAVAYLDSIEKCWVSGEARIGLNSMPHWMRLPASPIYDGDVK
jgi:hypothetical protein